MRVPFLPEPEIPQELMAIMKAVDSAISEQATAFLESDEVRADFRYFGKTFYRIGEGSIERVDPMDVFAPPEATSSKPGSS
jgi:hypothetical protein